MEETSEIPTTNEKLTTALSHAKNHKVQFQTFLEDGRLVISNNLCESHIRPFATAMPELDYAYRDNPELLDKYLPWSEELPAGIRMNRKNRKCL